MEYFGKYDEIVLLGSIVAILLMEGFEDGVRDCRVIHVHLSQESAIHKKAPS